MSKGLREKTDQYEEMLSVACHGASVAPTSENERRAAARECLEMATAYLEDGRYFRDEKDLPNALAAFAYGHGWLDAGIRVGLLVEESTSSDKP